MTLLELPTIRRASESPLIGALLAEQQTLTAVERFAEAKQNGDAGRQDPRVYRDLIPLAAPQPGEQYAFSVYLDACSGCKACVTACHSLNGLDESETFRDVGALTGRDHHGLHVLQHVTTACHHCLEPACLTGCPTLAYDKDPATGIVRHLDDQCIGCQYCTLMCPYDVPKYNAAKGIVRKCDMCRQRLVDGEPPACVQACPSSAIRIEVVRTGDVRQSVLNETLVPLAPDSRLTQPTTRFVTRRPPLHDASAVNDFDRPGHAHLPLVLMLVLTQMSIGMFVAAEALLVAGTRSIATIAVAGLIGLAGLAAAVLHLGRPQIAYRAWLGWRTSWMSREIVAFGVFLAIAGVTVLVSLLVALDAPLAPYLVLSTQYSIPWTGRAIFLPTLESVVLLATCASGAAALICSAMIYVATRREFWSARRTIPRFIITAVLLGSAGALLVLSATGQAISPVMIGVVLAAAVLRLMADISQYEWRFDEPATQCSRSTELLTKALRNWNHTQALAAMLGGVLVPLAMFELPLLTLPLSIASLVLLVAAELIQRGLFFAAAVGPRMPGVNHA
jgi:formate dehydrogenase iron-sulfur subunit